MTTPLDYSPHGSETKRRIVAGDPTITIEQWDADSNEWVPIPRRFILPEDVYGAYLAGRNAKGPSQRSQALEKDLASGVVRGVAIPSSLLRDPAFLPALRAWLQGRGEKGKLPTRTALTLTFQKLLQWGPARAAAALLHSAEKGYTGVFEEGGIGKKAPLPPGPSSSANAERLRARMGQ